jgi:hypothetical protein
LLKTEKYKLTHASQACSTFTNTQIQNALLFLPFNKRVET